MEEGEIDIIILIKKVLSLSVLLSPTTESSDYFYDPPCKHFPNGWRQLSLMYNAD